MKKIFLTSTGLTSLKVREAILGEIGKMQNQLDKFYLTRFLGMLSLNC